MVLSPAEVDQALTTVPDWSRDGDMIVRNVEASSFLAGLDIVTAVGRHAEDADHHPDIDIRWRTLTFRLTTHSDGGLTEKDFELARTIDGLV